MSSGRFVVHLPVRVANLAAARRFARTLTRALSFFPNIEAAGTTGWNELRYAGVSGAVEGTGCGVSCGGAGDATVVSGIDTGTGRAVAAVAAAGVVASPPWPRACQGGPLHAGYLCVSAT
ncbi:hypothetical protein Jiend_35060 [Micromonospora endophytica]|nr:hypothetical protein Jiend_35060 [Micromonospora endophytica]